MSRLPLERELEELVLVLEEVVGEVVEKMVEEESSVLTSARQGEGVL